MFCIISFNQYYYCAETKNARVSNSRIGYKLCHNCLNDSDKITFGETQNGKK